MPVRASIKERFDELIKIADQDLNQLFLSSLHSPTLTDLAKLIGWQTACLHLVEKTFGENSAYSEALKHAFADFHTRESRLANGIEIMKGAKEEIKKGFLYKVEYLIAADVFDSVLEQAEHLLDAGFRDAAAVLGRVVIESSLKKIAQRENIEFDERIKPSKLNDILFNKGLYARNVWRITQGHIDTGNYAAHGDSDKYDEQAVKDMLRWIRETILRL
jgi:hypothetical protein